jgi:radical SAM superfamily enzyme YgiQ (UPF0313 family)
MVGYTQLVRTEPLALEIIAASVMDRHEVELLDLRIDPEFEQNLVRFRPHMVGVTGFTTDVPRMLEILRQVKEHNAHITTVAGGYHASLVPEDFSGDHIDFIVVGEGEFSFPELVEALEDGRDVGQVDGLIINRDGRQVATPPRKLVRRLDDYPLPARRLTDKYRDQYHFHFWNNPYVVETARGCPYRCTFCAVWKFHQGMCRFRSPEKVMEDLRECKTDTVCFVDDNFFQSFRRVEILHELISKEGLKMRYWAQIRSDSVVKRPDIVKMWSEIGFHAALVGFEKFREKELADVNKRNTVMTNEKAMEIMHRYDVDMWGAFIIDPQWTEKDFDEMIAYSNEHRIQFPQFTILTPLPGTDFYKEKEEDLITRNYEVFDFLHTVLPTKLPIDKFYSEMARLYKSTTTGWPELRQRIRAGKIEPSALRRMRDMLRNVTNPDNYLQSVPADYRRAVESQ